MPFAFAVFVLSTLVLPCAHPHLYFPRCFSSLSPGNQHAASPREQNRDVWGHLGMFGDRDSCVTSAAAFEAQGAGEGTHGRVEGIAHGRGLAGGGVRLAAVAVGLAGLLVHPQGGQGQLLPAGERQRRAPAVPPRARSRGDGRTPYLFSRRPLPVSRKPLAKGLLSIFSWVICEGGEGERGQREALAALPSSRRGARGARRRLRNPR